MSEFVVYDLEFTSWEGAQARRWSGPGEHREIVQIGAVRLDRDWRELASFQVLVKPRRNPRLSDYFTALTGIGQHMLDQDGIEPEDALGRFAHFVGPDSPILSNGPDHMVIDENCGLLGIANPFAGRGTNVHPHLCQALGRGSFSSADLPTLLGFDPHGRGHTALTDARNVASALRLTGCQSNSKAFL
ncbi:3'-5' exonuclease [Magnetospirillum sp. 64-120]|uniref:3'-5' exonuclease n=1 Tax=Magnetospirillum sp. 64-120 TaxID=1895778 RepID=UPI0009259AF3|nr:3'-5' exonuclease [Magnetospirillum sp. 64-120]OJX68153.1 MAG: hypothetical protein BGO92_05730 [Magnetospirillum sp. 64-120]